MNGIRNLFAGMRSSSTGLSAERARIDVIARNVANSNTTRTEDGGPYRRRVVRFQPLMERNEDGESYVSGVHVAGIEKDYSTPFELVRDPSHPDADADGFVSLPNISATKEMADLITAMRAYDANLKVQQSFMQMAERALELSR